MIIMKINEISTFIFKLFLSYYCIVILHDLNLFYSDELRQLRTEKDDLQKETECWKAEQIKERDEEKERHKWVPVFYWIRNNSFTGEASLRC